MFDIFNKYSVLKNEEGDKYFILIDNTPVLAVKEINIPDWVSEQGKKDFVDLFLKEFIRKAV